MGKGIRMPGCNLLVSPIISNIYTHLSNIVLLSTHSWNQEHWIRKFISSGSHEPQCRIYFFIMIFLLMGKRKVRYIGSSFTAVKTKPSTQCHLIFALLESNLLAAYEGYCIDKWRVRRLADSVIYIEVCGISLNK